MTTLEVLREIKSELYAIQYGNADWIDNGNTYAKAVNDGLSQAVEVVEQYIRQETTPPPSIQGDLERRGI